MTEAPDTEATTDDEVKLLANGKVRVVLDGNTYMLRLPRLREFKRLRELFNDVNDPHIEALRRSQEANLRGEAGERLAFEDDWAEWLQEVFRSLGSKPLPDDVDDWLPWMPTSDFGIRLLNHWRAVPLARGAQ